MHSLMRTLFGALGLAFALGAGAAPEGGTAVAQATPAAAQPMPGAAPSAPRVAQASPDAASPAAANGTSGPPAGFVAPPEPQPGETNAQRAKTQPGNNAPFWRAVRESASQPAFTNVPGTENAVLIQGFTQYPGSAYTTAGEAWRQVRNHWIIPYGGWLLVLAGVALALFYWRVGPLGHEPNTGGSIERFTYFERTTHWANAIAFCILAISGIVMAFGKFFLLPIIGGALFGWLTYALKTVHNFIGPLFAVSLLIMIVAFVRDNLPRKGDLAWLKGVGAMVRGHEVPSHRFNAGEKLVFWIGVFLLGVIVVASGFVLDKIVPGLLYTRGTMQVAHMVHAVAAVLMMAVFAAHIYIGTVGVRGAYKSMRTGYVDENWAREHHQLWHDDIKAGKIPAKRTPEPVPPGVGKPA
jgi:formate dehydrogenase subunit gamma